MGARSQLAAALAATVDDVVVVADVDGLDSIDPAKRGVLQLVRTEIAFHDQARYLSRFEAWVAVNNKSLQEAEDPLDDIVDDVIIALGGFDWVTWETATRDVHPTLGVPAYRLNLTLSLKGV